MTMPVTARGGAAVTLASLNEGERDSLSTFLSRGNGCPLSCGRGGGWSLEEDVYMHHHKYYTRSRATTHMYSVIPLTAH